MILQDLDYVQDGAEKDIKSLVVVDEIVADGKTAAAMQNHLRIHGLPSPPRSRWSSGPPQKAILRRTARGLIASRMHYERKGR